MNLDKFEEATNIVKEVILETKLIYSDYFSDSTGNRVFFKPENLQLTGAYKVRGAYYKINTLTKEEREKGLITAAAILENFQQEDGSIAIPEALVNYMGGLKRIIK